MSLVETSDSQFATLQTTTVSPFSRQKPLFKKYDIRGEQLLFTPQFIVSLADAFARLYQAASATQIVIGYDARRLSIQLAHALADAFTSLNINVIWLGLVPTPLMAFWADKHEGHGIIATASHSPKNIAGIKWQVAGQSPTPEQIIQLYDSLTVVAKKPPDLTDSLILSSEHIDCISAYLSAIQHTLIDLSQYSNVTSSNFHPISVVIDCLNGTTGFLANKVFNELTEVIQVVAIINSEPNGDFPHGNPDPTESGRLTELADHVTLHHADVGIAFDGDGDRLAVVDDKGQVLEPDVLLFLLAQVAIASNNGKVGFNHRSSHKPQTKVLFDVKCSHHLPNLLQGIGADFEMVQTGSSLLRQEVANDNDVILAGELSGHYIFNDVVSRKNRLAGQDDAIYAGIRLLFWLTHQQRAKDFQTLSDILKSLPFSVATGDIYVPLPTSSNQQQSNQPILDTFKTLASCLYTNSLKQTLDLSADCRVTLIDGIRLDFTQGFGIIRPSNTSPSFTVRFAGNTITDLKQIQQVFVRLIQEVDEPLAERIAEISI